MAYPYSVGRWVVDGKTAATHYGLWQGDSITGKITPLDQIAAQAAAKCELPAPASFPSAVTGEQAELRVWIAVYDCFAPRPKRTNFKVYVDNPQRWLVEGEEAATETTPTIYYGLWTVDTTTGALTPWDNLASATAVKTCYHTP